MAGGNPYAERQRADREAQRRLQRQGLTVAPGVDGAGRRHVERGRGPCSVEAMRGGSVEDHDPQPAAVKLRPRLPRDRVLERVRVVGDEDDRGISMFVPAVVDDDEPRGRRPGAECLPGRSQQRWQPRVPVALASDRVAIKPEDDVVKEERAVGLPDALDRDESLEAADSRSKGVVWLR